MATFYMQGCSDENQAVSYFDSMYIPIQEMIDLDSTLQENLDALIFTEDDFDSVTDEKLSYAALDKSYQKLVKYVDELRQESGNITVFESEFHLKQAYDRLLDAYHEELTGSFKRIIYIMKMVSSTDKEMQEFNDLLHSSQTRLDGELEKFYATAGDFADRYQIEIVDED